MKKEPKAKRAKARRPVQRETKDVLAELVEKLRGKLELKATPASLGEARPRPELSPNLDRLTVGVDLGDPWSRYCILGLQGETLSEGPVQTRQAELAEFFQALTPARVVIEVGTHSAWVQEIIAGRGHEVLVANPRLMEGAKRRKRKNDRIDAHKLPVGTSGSTVVAPDHAPQSRGAPGLGVAARAGGIGGGADGADQHHARLGQKHGHTLTSVFNSKLRAQSRGCDSGRGTGSVASIAAISGWAVLYSSL
jgi:hypothetical protein